MSSGSESGHGWAFRHETQTPAAEAAIQYIAWFGVIIDTLMFDCHEDRTPTHGYEPTRGRDGGIREELAE